MFERFSKGARLTVKRAADIARDDGAGTVEAEHLLLAVVRTSEDQTQSVLWALGIDEASVRAAIDDEFTDSLRSAGVTITPPRPERRRRSSTPRWGQSAKLALERTLKVGIERGDRHLGDRHLALALARAEAGAVPRILRQLGVSPRELEAALL